MRIAHRVLLSLAALPALALGGDCDFGPVADVENMTPLELAQIVSEIRTKADSGPQKITRTVGSVTFDSDYDNGSLDEIVAGTGTDVYNATIYTEPGVLGTRKYWFRFTMTGVAGRTITLNIDHAQNPRPVVRVAGGAWRRTTAVEAPTTQRLVLSFPAGQNEAEVAFFYPFGVQETYDRVDELVAACPQASQQVIGSTTQGREVRMVTVTDPSVPVAQKKRIWVHSRAHAGESTSTYTMEGWLEQVTEDSALGAYLRRRYIFHIVPLLNVDGVFLGHTRWDSQGIDPEREWCNIQLPEVAAMRTQVDAFMASESPIVVALNLHSTINDFADTFFFKHTGSTVTPAFEVLQQNYIDAFNHATRLFDNRAAQTSPLNACLFIESYFWNNWGADVMAMTHEGHFYRRITDGEYITGDDYTELGRAQARALVEYFNGPLQSGCRTE